MDRIQIDMLEMVNRNHAIKREQKIAREIERKEKAKQFVTNLCGSILLFATCYILYIAGCCM